MRPASASSSLFASLMFRPSPRTCVSTTSTGRGERLAVRIHRLSEALVEKLSRCLRHAKAAVESGAGNSSLTRNYEERDDDLSLAANPPGLVFGLLVSHPGGGLKVVADRAV